MNRILSVLAVLIAGVALVVAMFQGSDPGPPLPTVDPARALVTQLDMLQTDYQTLKESHQQLRTKLAELELARTAPPSQPLELATLQQRLEALEAQQSRLTQFVSEFDQFGVIAAMEKEVVDGYSTLMNTNLPVGVRVKQAGILKRSGHFDEQAVQAMTDLYNQSASLEEKAAVLTTLTGHPNLQLRDQILADLAQEIQQGNQSGRFRYHAIEALEPMLPDPVVQEWLTHLAQNDPNPKIANRAGQGVDLTLPLPVKK